MAHHSHPHPHPHAHGDEHAGHAHPHPREAPRGTGAGWRDGEARRLWLTLGLSLLGVAVEASVGLLSNSLALLSDAGHLLTDAGSVALSLFALKVSTRPADARRTYGWYRMEILAALFNGAVLIALAAGIAWEAVSRLRQPEEVHLGPVVGAAVFGLALNAAGMWLTHVKEEHGSMNLRSTFLHLAGDLLNSVGVLVSVLLIRLTGWLQWDPLVSFLISATIVWSAVRLCRDAVDVLLENFPAHLQPAEVAHALAEVGGVAEVHDLHVWTITSGMVSLSCHLVVSCDGPGCRGHDEILSDAQAVLKEKFRIEHSTIQFESSSFKHAEVVH